MEDSWQIESTEAPNFTINISRLDRILIGINLQEDKISDGEK